MSVCVCDVCVSDVCVCVMSVREDRREAGGRRTERIQH